jgi:hypothetical protein
MATSPKTTPRPPAITKKDLLSELEGPLGQLADGLATVVLSALEGKSSSTSPGKKGLSTAGTAADAYKDFVPETDFRSNYSELVKAIWADPSLEGQIMGNPRLLRDYGFSQIPKKVQFAVAVGLPTPAGFSSMQDELEQGASGTVTIFIPPIPSLDDSLTTKDTTVCCSCCPCCCCT